MSKFLTEKLSVPQDHVTELVNPLRKTILSQLWSLDQDERIRYGDTIIVFYSGHGSTYSSGGVLRGGIRVEESDRDWPSFYRRNRINLEELNDDPSGPFIDTINPIDRGLQESDPIFYGRKVPDICDRELNTIFTITRLKKGPNIPFIAETVVMPQVLPRNGLDVTKWRSRSMPPLGRDDMEEMLLRAHWNIDQYAPWPTVSIFSDLGYG